MTGLNASASQVEGNNNNVNICQPKIEVKACQAPKTKIVVKTVEKVVEKVVEKPVVVEKKVFVEKIVERKVVVEKIKTRKNHVSLIGGYGPLGNLTLNRISDGYEAKTEYNAVMGAQYMREVYQGQSTSLDLLIQAQTNRTFSVGVGIGF